MKKTMLITLVSLAMPVSAQNGALSQLEDSAPVAAADLAIPAPVVREAAVSVAREGAEAADAAAKDMWRALDLVSMIEGVDFHAVEGDRDVLAADSISCVNDHYTACSMLVTVEGERKLIVTLEASVNLIQAFYSNGFDFDDETGILNASRVSCSKTGEAYACELEP